MSFRFFDPYKEERDGRAHQRALDRRAESNFIKMRALRAGNPEEKSRRIIHGNQTRRAKSHPVTVPSVWGSSS